MINNNSLETQGSLCYRIAQNILTDSDTIASCIEEAKRTARASKHDDSALLEARMVRHFAFQKFLSAYTTKDNTAYTMNILSIMEELDEITTQASNKDTENVIALQLSEVLDMFIHTLSEDEQTVYIRRYFFADSVKNIANTVNKATDEIKSILQKCNNNLISLLSDKGYNTKKETLFQCFTDISDNLIDSYTNTDTLTSKSAKKVTSSVPKSTVRSTSTLIPIAFAVALLAIVLVVISLALPKDDNTSTPVSDNTTESSSTNTSASNYAHVIENRGEDGFVIISELLTYSVNNPDITKDIISFNTDDLTISYMGYRLSDHKVLKECLGTKLTPFCDDKSTYYALKGHEDIKYIIHTPNHETYYLYKLHNVVANSTTATGEGAPTLSYGTVLSQVYGLDNTNNIAAISINPMIKNFESNETNEAIAYIVKHDEIEAIFKLIANMTYTDENITDLMEYRNSYYDYVVDTSVKLTITTANGDTIDNIHYRFSDKYFYDPSNTIFSTVSDEDHTKLCSMFNIEYNLENAVAWDPDACPLIIANSYTKQHILHLDFRFSDASIDGLYISNWYELERLVDNEWVYVEPLPGTSTKEDSNIFAYKIHPATSGHASFDMDERYGELPAGKYRVTTSVSYIHTYNTDKHTEKLYYTEFEVKE